jgi:hypothetical protein
VNSEDLEISARFCGPPNSGNGGYVCGRIAKNLSGAVAVRLKAPPPLNTVLRREWTTDSARLLHEATVIGEAKTAPFSLEPPSPPSIGQAERAAESCPGFKRHVFPRCFVCGPARSAGDGLRIFPGLLGDSTIYAAPWVPDPSLTNEGGKVASEFIWSALDCPSGFAVLPVPEGMAIVLGELCVAVQRDLMVGKPTVVSAWPIAHEGRRRISGSAVHTSGGELVAVARAVWIEVPTSQWTAGA